MKSVLLSTLFLALACANPSPAARPEDKAAAATNAAGIPAEKDGQFWKPHWCPQGNCQGCNNGYCAANAPPGWNPGNGGQGGVINGNSCPNGNCNGCLSTNGQYYCPLSSYGGRCPNNGNCNNCVQQNGQTYCPNNNNNNGINNGNNCPNGNCNGCTYTNGQQYCPISNNGNQCPNGNCNGCISQNGQQYCPTNNFNNGINNGNNCPNGNCNGCTYTNGQQYCPLSNTNGQCPNNNCGNCISQNGQTMCPNYNNNGVFGNNFFQSTSLYVDPTGTYTFGFIPTSTSASCGKTSNGVSTYSQCISVFYGSNGQVSTITGYTGKRTTFTYTATSAVTAWSIATSCGNINGLNQCSTYSYPTSVSYHTYSVVSRAAATKAAEPMPLARNVIAQGIVGAVGLAAAVLL